MPNGIGLPAGAGRGMPPRGMTGGQPGGGQQRGNQERVLMTLLTMLSQMPEAQVMLPVGALTTLVEGGGMGSLQPSAVGGAGGRGPGSSIGPTGARPQPTRPPGGVMGGGMQRTQTPARQMMGGAQPRGNAQALMGLLGGG